MILGRFFNSLQYIVKQYDRNWLRNNQYRRDLSPNYLQKIILKVGRRPLLTGLVLLGIFSFLSLAVAFIDSSHWALIIVEKFKIEIVQLLLITMGIDYFVYHKSIKCIKIEGKVK